MSPIEYVFQQLHNLIMQNNYGVEIMIAKHNLTLYLVKFNCWLLHS